MLFVICVLFKKYLFFSSRMIGHQPYDYQYHLRPEFLGLRTEYVLLFQLYKNVAERGKWGEHLMEAHRHYREGRTDEAFVIYALLAELGYEVAQSNAGFILDRGELFLSLQLTESD